ncbi:hypothetical protein AA309_19115 [Microvirga vignae]|uniref:Uncharacterized protein n=1 Tax=Microvirga vignae TaxID=1225564 RepID=A0A0H1R992_9HYPH|nr:hypothetical protein AA309_19115 [Microvirga vignae]
MRTCGEQMKLFGERRLAIAGIPRLLFAHHMNHLDAAQDHTGTARGLESEHGRNPPLDGPMILLNAIIEVGALSDANGFQFTLRSILQTALRITRQDRFAVRLAAVITILSGRRFRLRAWLRKRLAADRSRRSLNQNSTVSPVLSTAR